MESEDVLVNYVTITQLAKKPLRNTFLRNMKMESINVINATTQ